MSSQVFVGRPYGALSGVVAALSRAQPATLFWAVLVLHVALWTLVPGLVLGNAPLDVIEGLAWGRAWELGYHKHPPLFAWVAEATMRLSGDRIWSIYLLSQLCIGITFFSVWRLGQRVLRDDRLALIAVLLLEGVYYYGIPSPEFNPLILQMALWALLAWRFHHAIVEDRQTDWLLVGILAGLDILTRYSSGVLLAALGLFLLLHPLTRRLLRSPGPYLALAVAAAIVTPHVIWLIAADFPTLGYVMDRAPKVEQGLLAHLLLPAKFLGAQLAALAPTALLFLALIWPLRRRGGTENRAGATARASDFNRAYLATVTFGPVLIAVLASSLLGVGLRSMWGAQMWAFVGVFALAWWRPANLAPVNLRRFAGFWAATAATTLVVFAAMHILQPIFFDRKKRTAFPGRDLARIVTERWHAEVGTKLPVVIGKVWAAGNVSVYSPDRPAVFIDANEQLSPWIDAARLGESGGVIVWIRRGRDAQDPWQARGWGHQFSAAVVQPPIQLPWHWHAADKRPLEVGWAILYPEHQRISRRLAAVSDSSAEDNLYNWQ